MEILKDSNYKPGTFDPCAAKWDFYKIFYDYQMRNENDNAYGMLFGKKSNRIKCRDTNMIQLAVYYLENNKNENYFNLIYDKNKNLDETKTISRQSKIREMIETKGGRRTKIKRTKIKRTKKNKTLIHEMQRISKKIKN